MDSIETLLDRAAAVITGRHFQFTSGAHSSSYLNLRVLLSHPAAMAVLGRHLVEPFLGEVDLIFGPETGGRSFAEYAAVASCDQGHSVRVAWAQPEDAEGVGKKIVFNEKLGFESLIPGARILVVDDLLTKGSTLSAVIADLRERGGNPVAAATVVRREAETTAEVLGVDTLHTLHEPTGLSSYNVHEGETCELCEAGSPMVVDLGHGAAFQQANPEYPGGWDRVLTA